MSRLAIIGSNDLGKLIAHHAINNDWTIAGFFDNKKEPGTSIDKYGTVLGNIESVESFYSNKAFEFLIVGVGYTQFGFRKTVFERFKGIIPFANLIHNNSYVDKSVNLGEGIFILPGCILDMEVQIEDNVLLNTGCRIAHHSIVKKHSFLAPGVTVAGKSVIDECCFLGVGSVVLDNVNIHARTLIGAGSVVTKNIAEEGTYIGTPAKKIKNNIYF